MIFLIRKIGDFAGKKSYPSEFTYAIFSFIFLLPALLFASFYYISGVNAVCNILFWSIIVYFLPFCLFVLLFSLFPNLSLPSEYFVVIVQFILNTIALVKILLNKQEKNKDFWLCLGLIFFNYAIMVFVMYTFSIMGDCYL